MCNWLLGRIARLGYICHTATSRRSQPCVLCVCRAASAAATQASLGSYSFVPFGCVLLAALAFVLTVLPETHGRTPGECWGAVTPRACRNWVRRGFQWAAVCRHEACAVCPQARSTPTSRVSCGAPLCAVCPQARSTPTSCAATRRLRRPARTARCHCRTRSEAEESARSGAAVACVITSSTQQTH